MMIEILHWDQAGGLMRLRKDLDGKNPVWDYVIYWGS